MPKPKLTWGKWLKNNCVSEELLHLSKEQQQRPWAPSEKDREAAWILYTEIRTRITTQQLHYRSGDEETALDSLYKLFALTRKTIEDNGPECRNLAFIAIEVLNTHIRPLTAKWHKKKIAGHLQHDDDRRNFRQELSIVQVRLVEFGNLLNSIVEGDEHLGSDVCEPSSDQAEEKDNQLGTEIPFDRILFEGWVTGSDDLFKAEFETIRERRNGQTSINNLAGLACSGGGIRSATFCLGVAQSLHRHGLLPKIDYLSTVSGGGYFGSFLSSYLNDSEKKNVGLEPDKLPFAEKGRPEARPIRQLRNNSKYLLKGGLLGQSRMAGLLMFGILVNLLTLSPVLFGALTLTKVATLLVSPSLGLEDLVGILLACLLALLLLVLFGLPIVYRLWASKRKRIARYERLGIILMFALAGIWIVGWVLPWGYQNLRNMVDSPGIIIGVFGFLPFLFAGTAFSLGTESAAGRALIVLTGITGPLLLIMTHFVLNEVIDTSWMWVIGLFALSVALIAWLRLVNVNQVSAHRYYRNRLAETYLLRRGQDAAIDPQPLSELRSNNVTAPYHLINAAVNLPSSKEPELRGRNSDFFLFSQKYCGSPLLGYCETKAMEAKDPNINLGTAMSISGAAASAYMGTTTISGLTFWLSLLNIRLAYWLPNPKRLAGMPDGLGVRPFSLWRELFGRIDENGQFVNLSDGGHIENLGIYELLRRRCKFIIAIDGEADPTMAFPSLMKLIRYAKIDFGINIQMDLDDLSRNQAGFTKAHFVLGEIDYGDGLIGYLLYIKSSLTGNEPDYILDYQRNHADFPHETTADQFFSEAQFEAYRRLGDHIGEDLFHRELIKGAGNPITLESWFSALVRNLKT